MLSWNEIAFSISLAGTVQVITGSADVPVRNERSEDGSATVVALRTGTSALPVVA